MATVNFKHVSQEVYALSSSSHSLAPLVREALTVIDDALDEFGLERLSLSFNGGKDCTVLLHLLAASLGRRNLASKRIPAVYIPVPSPFPQLESFVEETAREYHLDLFHCPLPEPELPVETIEAPTTPPSNGHGKGNEYIGPRPGTKVKGGEGMKRALQLYKERFPRIDAILIGTRKTDPDGAKLSFRSPTDADWPRFQRVNPILDWSYSAVWDYLRKLKVPYCNLYDEGYTSLGSTYNTFRNPALLIQPACTECLPPTATVVSEIPPLAMPHSHPTDLDNHHPHAPDTPVSDIPASDTISAFPLPDHIEIIPGDPGRVCIADANSINPLPDKLEMIRGDPSLTCHADATGVDPLPDRLQWIPGDPSALCIADACQCEPRYRPAYELLDENLERAGRASGIRLPM
ncbi:adenine nucleotide alpha hydrolases-like protein [Laetiporus sulphureus 93-53]|uniref:FAD synthase n=1 Tax=Laetiporus sulphureus 93-53 TaxID=1314785 RepID=A0A165BNB0_9APHY|nr:adenine nucleotide alpha hydrolases-like protein [Laetiporus sulphureus 93-53]KZT01354.1 adenine nucleotide alpha hydrolases-like protein [Laetiporus sulphureus 93-53]